MDRNVQVTAADVARLAGVGRAAVSNWRRRHDDFPQPTGGTATSPSFALGEIQSWLRSHAEGRELPAQEWLWQDLRAAVDEDELAGLIADLGAFLIYLDRAFDDWRLLAEEDDAAVAAELPKRVQAVGAPVMESPAVAKFLYLRQLIPLVRDVARTTGELGLRETFTFLRERYFELHTKRMYATPTAVAELMVELIDPRAESVLDPACGSGALLAAAQDRRRASVRLVLGQEIDEATARLTSVSLALASVTDRPHWVDVRAGDALREQTFAGTLVDALVCNPPFNDRNWGYEELTADARWEYGLPPRMESELAWVQHALAQLKVGGTAVMLMPPAVAGRRSGRRIRGQLLRRGALRAVIALPLGVVPNMAVALTLWVLRRPAETRTPDHVLMVDTSARPGDYAALAVRAWNDFCQGHKLDDPGVSRCVPVVDLLDDDVDLSPARYLSLPSEELTAARVTGQHDRMADLLRATVGAMPAVEPTTEPPNPTWISVSELIRRGMLTLHHQAPAKPGETSKLPDGVRMLTIDDVVRDVPPTAVAPNVSVQREIVLRPGDVVVPQLVRRPVARVIQEGGPVLGPRLSLLRLDQDVLDPHFVAGFIGSSVNTRNSVVSTMGSRSQVDVRRAELPLMPLDEQRAYGAAFRRLAEFQSLLRQAAALGEDLAQLTADGLAHGSVRPSPGKL